MHNKIISSSFLAFFLLCSPTSCLLAAQNKTSAATTPIYTQEKPNIVVTADAPLFTLKLESNPTTGYTWFLQEYDASLIQPVSHHYEQGDKKLIGSPGYELWTFKVKPAGFIVPHRTSLRFLYARGWEGADNSTQAVFRISTQ